ncbi:MAG: rhodanese-like domain-containing protein [Chloroflexota bacterium]
MFVQQFFVEGLGHASYLIGSDQTREAALVDPNRDVTVYLEAARAAGLRISHILETHVHNDFLSGAKAIADRIGATYVASADAGLRFPYWAVSEGDEIRIGELIVRVLSTPGHTPEHVSYLVTDTSRATEPVLVFSGGDLLVGSVGRPDLLGRELGEQLAPKLYDSLFGKLLKLEDYVEVLPTHGAGSLCGRAISSKRTTTVGYERRFNVFLQHTKKADFVDFVLEGNPNVPAYYRRMRPGNLDGADAFVAPAARPMRLDEVHHALGHGSLIVDARDPLAFGAGHIPGAYNVGLGAMFATWVGVLLPADVPLILVLEREDQWTEAVTALGRIGYENVAGYLLGGMASWIEASYPVEAVEQVSASELAKRLQGDHPPRLVDVRLPGEWEQGGVAAGTRIALHELPDHLAGLDLGQPLTVVCATGYRASIAASILQRAGAARVATLMGGTTAWTAAGRALTPYSVESREPALAAIG